MLYPSFRVGELIDRTHAAVITVGEAFVAQPALTVTEVEKILHTACARMNDERERLVGRLVHWAFQARRGHLAVA